MSVRVLIIIYIVTVTSFAVAATNEVAERFYLKGVEKNKAGLLIVASVLLTEAIANDELQHR